MGVGGGRGLQLMRSGQVDLFALWVLRGGGAASEWAGQRKTRWQGRLGEGICHPQHSGFRAEGKAGVCCSALQAAVRLFACGAEEGRGHGDKGCCQGIGWEWEGGAGGGVACGGSFGLKGGTCGSRA